MTVYVIGTLTVDQEIVKKTVAMDIAFTHSVPCDENDCISFVIRLENSTVADEKLFNKDFPEMGISMSSVMTESKFLENVKLWKKHKLYKLEIG